MPDAGSGTNAALEPRHKEKEAFSSFWCTQFMMATYELPATKSEALTRSHLL
ncbi:hypothetical protein IQ238_29960 [Pleurocapsales cyanobacterium LEGE 06147]|nr:hypothetical protein [Pleurocapsales cyanobacterium LEGE 06147]